ncbi:5-amino-6-(D-ribitylamino)uracil--L-tyrosine 4-hydroxyphenyl transferase CofH [Ancylobacter terrae]|uniref:5-amino-6-(D-ribitylamino)uracil--L-tyrosine 4-hydroxyphenyl transferase CofH n=1 Tax=Ancylobacter sp. sgz301288 TaxID=3342077 RepID=UPI00385C9EB0
MTPRAFPIAAPAAPAGILAAARAGVRPSPADALSLAGVDDLAALASTAAAIRDAAFGDRITYSRKVFIPLTHLCRDVCHYCTFAKAPRRAGPAYLSPGEVLAIAEAGRAAGCKEALFTLGDKPELRYRAAREALDALGHATTLDYLEAMAKLVLERTGLMPHLNPGVMSAAEIARLRRVSLSMGIMLETAAERLSARGGPHFGSPDKHPAVRLATIAAAGAAQVPFTSGLLIGIGETRAERIEALLALRDLDDAHDHLQEIIVQNFRAKPDTRMAASPEPDVEDHLWTVAVARIVMGAGISIQAPPNLQPGALGRLIGAGIDDWGGVSPVTADHVNPEAPWPHLDALAAQTACEGKVLVERLAAHPRHLADPERWIDPALRPQALRLSDAEGFARTGDWTPGVEAPPGAAAYEARHKLRHRMTPARAGLERALARASAGEELGEDEITQLFAARGDDFWRVCEAADAVRRARVGDGVGYVVTRNINYTNVCTYRCQFCAFSKGKMSENLRGRPYDLDLAEIAQRAGEAWARGATEVCIQGGIHPAYTGAHYLAILAAVKAAVPQMHIHAFSPLEIWQGAASLGLPLRDFLGQLKAAGLGSLPGTAAEILDDEVRAVICPDKVTTDQWLEVIGTAHELGLRTTSTIMYGHVERPVHWARHLIRLRRLQARTSGITEFVPLPFVPMEAPMYLKGRSRAGATLREAVLMHAVGRLALHPLIPNIQASWVKLGVEGVKLCLEAGANDFGGTLMDESISRAAGAAHGQDLAPRRMEEAIRALGRTPRPRTTLYADAPEARRQTVRQAYEAPEAWQRAGAPPA